MKWIDTLIHRPALVIVIYLIGMIFGLFGYSKLPIDMLPEIESPVVSVVTTYPGASALDVETKVSEPIEEALGSVSNLKSIASNSRENISLVTLVFDGKADIDEAANDVRQNLELVKNQLPTDAGLPVLKKIDLSQLPIVNFAVYANGQDVRVLRDVLKERLFDPLRQVPGVGSVLIQNAPEMILRVDVHRDRLYAHGLTMTEVAKIVQANNLSIPAGDLSVGKSNFSLRMSGEFASIEEMRDLPLIRSPMGEGVVRLGDIADVQVALDDVTEQAFVNQNVAILGDIRKTSSANTVEVTDKAMELFAKAESALPGSVRIEVLESGAKFIRGTISNLQRTVLAGAFLVALIVFLFLRRIGPTIIVALSIPTSMILTFLVVYMMGYTLNSVTLIAMSLAVGLVVDNGVVALENISRKIDEGSPPLQASYEGAVEVAGALFASTMTTLVIFAPMMFISGIVGQMFGQLAVVMIVTIAASLCVALTLTPMLAGRWVRRNAAQTIEQSSAVRWWEKSYRGVLEYSLQRPWYTLISSAGIGVLTIVLLSQLGSDFLPKDDVGQVAYTVELPVGSTMEQSLAVGEKYVQALRAKPEVEVVSLRVGSSADGGMGQKEGKNIARVRARLAYLENRSLSDQEIGVAVMQEVGDLPEVVNLDFSRDGSGAGALGAVKPIVVEILGLRLDDLQKAAMMIQQKMENIPGTMNVNADLVQTQPELQVQFSRQQLSRIGIPFAVTGQELRAAMTGITASRYTGGDKARDIVLRFRQEDRSAMNDWSLVPIRSGQGRLTSLGALGSLHESESPIEIKRKDKARVLTVSTEISGRSLGEVAADVEKELAAMDLPDGVQTQIAGAIKDQRESFGDMGLLLAMGMILVYLVMVAQFESWSIPFVIMFSVPFAATGAFLALLLSGTNLSVTSFLGLVILIGVVVNNAIVLIDYIQLLRSRGMELLEAVKEGGQRRLRPVLITTLTTSGGMLPLALTTGEGEQLWGPMGKTALGGLLVSSVVTLVLVPTMFVIVSRWTQKKPENTP